MNAVGLLAIGVAMFAFGWFIYSRFLAKSVLRLDEDFVTPAHELRDDVDFVPTNKFVLWGHHFTAVAGAAPIVGPAIAVKWGWLPAFLWVVLGTVFFAGVHDISAIWASVRHKGRSIGSVCQSVVGNRVGQLFMVVIFLVLLMVNSAFGVVIAKESVQHASTIIPAWGAIAIALIMGQLIYRAKLPLLPITVVAVIALYALIPLGVAFPVNLPDTFMGMDQIRQWVIILFVYAGIASILPVWALLQPRDYVNGIQLFIALALLFVSILIVHPSVIAPAIAPAVENDWTVVVPILFITVACGAISGFHGIVSSGTTSKQIDKYRDIRFVGYLGSTGEGSLSLATIIGCVAGIGLVGTGAIGSGITTDTWESLYKGGAAYFVNGGGAIISHGTGLSTGVGQTILSLMVILFAATTMDAGIRLQRYIIQEWGDIYKIGIFRSKWVATLLAVATSFLLAYNGIGEGGKNEVAIWPLFGATNQLLASLTLVVISVMLMKLNRVKQSLVALLPMSFILVMAFWGACIKMVQYYGKGELLLFVISIVVIVVTLLVALFSFAQIARVLRARKAGVDLTSGA